MDKKRPINEVKPRKRTLKRQDRDFDEEDRVENGGSSQDKFESDFIDDDASENGEGESDGEYNQEVTKKGSR